MKNNTYQYITILIGIINTFAVFNVFSIAFKSEGHLTCEEFSRDQNQTVTGHLFYLVIFTSYKTILTSF